MCSALKYQTRFVVDLECAFSVDRRSSIAPPAAFTFELWLPIIANMVSLDDPKASDICSSCKEYSLKQWSHFLKMDSIRMIWLYVFISWTTYSNIYISPVLCLSNVKITNKINPVQPKITVITPEQYFNDLQGNKHFLSRLQMKWYKGKL